MLLLGERRTDLVFRYGAGFDEKLADGLLTRQSRIHRSGRDIAALDQNFAEPVGPGRVLNPLDDQLHVIEQEQEDLLDGFARLVGAQHHVPTDMTFGWIQFIERRHEICQCDHRRMAQAMQFLDQP